MLGFKLFLLLAVLRIGVLALDKGLVLGMRSLHVESDIRFRFAQTRIIARFINPSTGYQSSYAVFHVTLPGSAMISDFRYYNTKYGRTATYVSRVRERSSMFRRYRMSGGQHTLSTVIGSKNPDGTKKFKVLVEVGPKSKTTFNFTYEEVLERSDGKYKHELFISPELPVNEMKINVTVHESSDMTNFQSYLRKETEDGPAIGKENIGQLDVQRPDLKSAIIRYKPTPDQMTQYENGISARLVVSYDFDRYVDGGEVLVFKDYFFHFFAPEVSTPMPKDVLFILDTSTSMFRDKLDQVKVAMKVILNDLGSEDRFNIISFGSRVNFWRKNLADARNRNIQKALEYLGELEALGWTNLMEPLSSGLVYMTNVSRVGQGMVIFLTDGRAVSGETSSWVIAENVGKANPRNIPVHTIAFGKDADWKLMKKLAFKNSGVAKKIKADESAAIQIEDFYKSISGSVLHSISFRYKGNVVDSTRSSFTSYETGSELIVAGQVEHFDPTSDVLATTSGGETTLKPNVVEVKMDSDNASVFGVTDLAQKMWIHLHLKDILKKMAKEPVLDEYEKLGQEAIKISWRYQLLTAVTAMQVTTLYGYTKERVEYREDKDSFFYLGELPMELTYAAENERKKEYYYQGYGSNRGGAYGDPHFMVYMAGLQYPICFDVTGRDDQMYQLVRDPRTDLMVNARMRNGRKKNKKGKSRLYYMTEFNIKLRDLHLHVTCKNVTLDGKTYHWNQNVNGTLPGANLYLKVITGKISRLSVIFESKLEIDITSHIHREPSRPGDDFLNIEIGNEHVLSKETDGLLGQFVHKHMRLDDLKFRKGNLVAELETRSGVDKHHGRARIVHRKDPIWNTTTSCWMIKKMGARLFDGPAEYYVIKSMNQTNLI